MKLHRSGKKGMTLMIVLASLLVFVLILVVVYRLGLPGTNMLVGIGKNVGDCISSKVSCLAEMVGAG